MKSASFKQSLRKNAFSLIELSMVILIIGIIVAGLTNYSRLLKEIKLTGARSMTASSVVPAIPNLVVWFETSLEKSFDTTLITGNKVTAWNNINPLSSDKYQFVSTNPTYQPTYTESGINGLPSIIFNNSHMFLYNFKIGANYTFFYVFQASTIHPSSSGIINIGDFSQAGLIYFEIQQPVAAYLGLNRRMRALHRASSGSPENDNYANSVGIVNDKKDYIYAYIRNNQTNKAKFYSNGVEYTDPAYSLASVPALTSANLTIFIGNLLPTNLARPFLGMLSELIIYDKILTTEELNEVTGYLLKKYRIK